MADRYAVPQEGSVIVDPTGVQLGTATDPLYVTGTISGTVTLASEGATGAPVPADAVQIGGENGAGDLEAPRIVTTASGPGFVVSDPALTDGSQLAQVTGTGAAGAPAAGVVSVQGVVGGTPITTSAPTSATGTTSIVAGSIATFTLLAANASRKGASIYNETGRNLFVRMGAGAALADYSVRVLNNGYLEVPFGYTGIITGICSGAGTPNNALVTEYT